MIGSLWFWLALAAGGGVVAFAGRARDALLLALSVALVASWDARAVLLLGLFTVVLHFAGPHLAPERPHSRPLTWALVITLVGSLVWFKHVAYQLFGVGGTAGAAMPLGISYFTFKLLHYVLELSRGRFGPAPPLSLLRYLLLFPAFVAGPIERWDHFDTCQVARLSREDIVTGLTRIVHGLIKKFVISDAIGLRLMGMVSMEMMANAEAVPPFWRLWGHLLGVFVWVYCDFAGYSDIALGGARLLGYRYQENFDSPFLATSVGDWWRRWHISLSNWCRDYVYLPVLGLTRRPILSGYCSMTVMAMWHHVSLNWFLWGLYQGSCLGIFQAYQLRQRKRRKGKGAKGKAAAPPPPGFAKRLALRVATFLTITAGYAFSTTDAQGVYAGLRMFAGLVGVSLPR